MTTLEKRKTRKKKMNLVNRYSEREVIPTRVVPLGLFLVSTTVILFLALLSSFVLISFGLPGSRESICALVIHAFHMLDNQVIFL